MQERYATGMSADEQNAVRKTILNDTGQRPPFSDAQPLPPTCCRLGRWRGRQPVPPREKTERVVLLCHADSLHDPSLGVRPVCRVDGAFPAQQTRTALRLRRPGAYALLCLRWPALCLSAPALIVCPRHPQVDYPARWPRVFHDIFAGLQAGPHATGAAHASVVPSAPFTSRLISFRRVACHALQISSVASSPRCTTIASASSLEFGNRTTRRAPPALPTAPLRASVRAWLAHYAACGSIPHDHGLAVAQDSVRIKDAMRDDCVGTLVDAIAQIVIVYEARPPSPSTPARPRSSCPTSAPRRLLVERRVPGRLLRGP